VDWKRTIEAIKESQSVMVTSHVNPDGDAVGSLLAIGLALTSMGKRVHMYLESPVPEFLRFLPGADQVRGDAPALQNFDTAVILDCGSLTRIGSLAESVESIPRIVNVDHHLYNEQFGTVNLVETSFCATASILYDMFKVMSLPPDQAIATNLYTGILTDTGSFRYDNTSGHVLAQAAELVELGVNPGLVARSIYLYMPTRRIRLLRQALASVERFLDGRIGVMALRREDFLLAEAGVEDTEGFIDYVRGIPGVEVAVLFKEVDDGTVTGVSLRSWGEVNSAEIARRFSGGGHAKAAGFRLNGRVTDHKNQVVSGIAEYLLENHGSQIQSG